MPNQPAFEVSARGVGARESEIGVAPDWAEIVLEIDNRDQAQQARHEWLTRSAGEAIIEVLHDVLHPHLGLSLRQMIWAELDNAMDQLMGGEVTEQTRGMAYGLAMAIAILTNPGAYDVDAIREEALARWEHRQEALQGV